MSQPTSIRKQRQRRQVRLGIGTVILIAVMSIAAVNSPSPGPLLAWRAPDEPSQDTNRRYFEETGFEVAGKFLEFFDSQGGLEIFGYPISAEYNQQGVMVQYFQKARMEWHVVGPHANQVTLGSLGDELGFREDGLSKPVKSTRRRLYFEETGHTVAYFFLKYFRDHGGEELFGPPITEMFIEDQKIVQYFQRLKLVWDPRLMRVTAGNLGDLYVMTYRDTFPPNVLTPLDLQFGDTSLQELVAFVGVSDATLAANRLQRIVVVVHSQGEDPRVVPDANVTVTLANKSGKPIPGGSYPGLTDADGRMETSVSLEQFRPGDVVIVKAEVGYGTLRTEAETSFVVWW